MKTINQWIDGLPPDYREWIRENCDTSEIGDEPSFNLRETMFRVRWPKDPEGNEIARQIYAHFAIGSPLPKLPKT